MAAEFDGDSINDIIGFRNIGSLNEIYFIKAISCAPLEYSSNLILKKPRFNGRPAFGDLDKDGDLDIVYSSGPENEINFMLNNGEGSFTDIQPNVKGSNRLYIDDIDADGDNDIIGYVDFPGVIYMYENLGGLFVSKLIYTSSTPIIDVLVENIDNSPVKEIMVGTVRPSSDDITILSKDISGNYSSQGIIAQVQGLRKIKSYDIDNNGLPNIICLSNQYVSDLKHIGQFAFELNDILGPSNINQHNITFGDYNTDGTQDLIIAYINNGSKWFKNVSTDNNTYIYEQLNIDGRVGPEPMISIDLDTDGDLDYLSLNIELDILENIMFIDYDKDGFGTSLDCDDSRPDINPDQLEVCDGVDNDCNGFADDIPFYTYYYDRDNDGYGSMTDSIRSCFNVAPDGFTTNKNDCDDDNRVIFIGNPEVCDGFDNDCNGLTDEGLTIKKYFLDADMDGFGTMSNDFILSCLPEAPDGYADNQLDCDDQQRFVNPGQIEFCDGLDNDCNGIKDDGLLAYIYYRDSDGDSFGNPQKDTMSCFLSAPLGYTINKTDCDDSNPDVNPNSAELCDNIDNNCSGQIDEGLMTRKYYRDLDGDGYGTTQLDTTVCDLVPPAGYSIFANDCNDLAKKIFPGAIEECDNIDNNCNGLIDDGLTKFLYFVDNDLDGYGDSQRDTMLCAISVPFGFATIGGDCNDQDINIFPGAPELCDNKDNNCSGLTDEGLTVSIYYRDVDADGYGTIGMDTTVCSSIIPQGYSTLSNDCNDFDNTIFPGSPELCDNIDNDCSGVTDDGLSKITYFIDIDGDGFGSDQKDTITCAVNTPIGYSNNSLDCDDNNANINPNSPEICDNMDNNCSGQIDEGLQKFTYYIDNDNDGFGTFQRDTIICSDLAPQGFSQVATDCDDSDSNINPNSTEICDNKDNNCSGQADEGLPVFTFYLDNDSDGFGSKISLETCNSNVPDKYTSNSNDCDDNNFDINPDATEIPLNGIDEDCSGEDFGLTDLEILNGINIVNPANKFVFINNPSEFPIRNDIFDITGKFIMQVESNKYVYIPELPKGVYIYKRTMTSSGIFVSSKFIVVP